MLLISILLLTVFLPNLFCYDSSDVVTAILTAIYLNNKCLFLTSLTFRLFDCYVYSTDEFSFSFGS